MHARHVLLVTAPNVVEYNPSVQDIQIVLETPFVAVE
jgi:hypothetical protein